MPRRREGDAGHTVLLEIGTEEMPARFLPGALEALGVQAQAALAAHRIAAGTARTYGTPRRLAVLIQGVADRQADAVSETKGPPAGVAFDAEGRPTRAAEGFARRLGIGTDALEVRETADGPYVFGVVREPGRPVREVIGEALSAAVRGLEFPKTMRWGAGAFAFARPVRWICALWDDEPIALELAGVRAGPTSVGHRFLAPGPVAVGHAGRYPEALAGARVVADPEARRARVLELVRAAAREAGGEAAEDPGLVDEVTHLVEWPGAVAGSFDADYLALPEVVLITTMARHQRYFPVRGGTRESGSGAKPGGGRLLPRFVAVTNGAGDPDVIRAGNERVLRARLADAVFFFEDDRKAPLESRLPELDRIGFLEGLGTVGQKVVRVRRLAARMLEAWAQASGREGLAALPGSGGPAARPPEALAGHVDRAARLCKADLATAMVREFAELEGVMGREYARLDGEPEPVAEAIFEHRLPRFAGDAVARTPAGIVVGVADKLDTVVASFAAGVRVTGSADPFGLRRQAAGLVATAVARSLPLDLAGLAVQALKLLLEQGVHRLQVSSETGLESVRGEVLVFLAARLRTLLEEEGLPYDAVEAALGAHLDPERWGRGAWAPAAVAARARALAAFKRDPAYPDLLAAHTRVAGLGKQAPPEARVDLGRFTEPCEGRLWDAAQAAAASVERALSEGDPAAALRALSDLRPAADAFFDAVLVMAEDAAVRSNRLALLGFILQHFRRLGDLDKLTPA